MFTVKKLKISGFKSFAHATEILIEDGVTGIIGPNGCGKSNIFEAIRWVMGESSSKSLRSGSQDEIIFNGTQSIPAKNFAEVTLELEDFTGEIPNISNDEKKIVISRILERGVGSFFKINNKDARAKDVSIMFYDSGSGARSSSIIGQGNIDQIINFKPIDRKIILEDAAGTSGLQARRHESELKLQSTESNLEKIDLNLNNLYENQKGLSRQARQAERYEQMSKDIKDLQSKILLLDWKKIESSLNIDQEKKNKISNEVQIILSNYKEINNKNDANKEKFNKFLKEKETLSEKLFQLEKEISEQKNKIENIKNKKEEIQRFLETVLKDKNNEKNNLIEIKKNIKKTEQEISSLHSQTEERDKINYLLKNEKKIKDEIKQLETLYVNEIQLSLGEEFKSDSLKENKENLEKDIKKIIEEVYLLKSKNKDNKLRLSELNQNLKILKKHNENKQQDLIKKKIALKKYEEKNVKLDKEITSNLDKIEILSLQYKEIQTEIKTLGEIAIENQLSDSSIVNLIKIKKGFENSVYAALNHELDATLKNSKKRWVKTEFQKLTEIQNPLSNFVEGPNELLLILSQIGFVNDDSRALDLQKNLSVGQILVNKEGTIWRWDGFISEDNLQKKKLLDSHLRVKELSSKEKLIQKQLSDLEKIKVRQINEKENNAKNLLAVNTSIESLYQEIDNLTPEISKSNEQKSIIQLNVENTINKMSQLNKILENSNKKLEEVKISESASFKNNKTSTNDVQNKISELDQNLESVRNQINLLKQKIMRGELNKTYYENDLLKSKKIFEETSKKILMLEKREGFYNKENYKLADLPTNFSENINNLQGEINKISNQIKINLQNQNEISNQILSDEKDLEKINKDREMKQNEITIIETNLTNNSSKEKEFRELIFQKTSNQPEDLNELFKAEGFNIENYMSFTNKLEKLIAQREQMGPVNLRAKLEEEEIKRVIDELELEKNDLVQAIDKLRIAISKINNEGKKRLIEAFDKVDKNFRDLFKKLFNGGEAKLELIKSDDPLQTGIEIYARPPGKKLSSLSLLSGGEKTLTAISLIFSIFLINPSPICILDEVDAALDEINVQKFCKLLEELKSNTKTKFLIITHNKITMSSLDRVYGVTMAQKGISDVVSVDFKDVDLKKAV